MSHDYESQKLTISKWETISSYTCEIITRQFSFLDETIVREKMKELFTIMTGAGGDKDGFIEELSNLASLFGAHELYDRLRRLYVSHV